MRITEAFPSNYLRAGDLQDRNVTVVIDRVDMEEIGGSGDHKPVIYFQGKEKGMVLNKTNAANIAVAYGDDTDNWSGGEIVLFPAMVDFQGRSVAAIRVRVPPRKPGNGAGRAAPGHTEASPPAHGAATKPTNGQPRRDDMSDDIPF